MNEVLLIILEIMGMTLIALGLGGLMTVAIFMVSPTLKESLLPSSARTTEETTYPVGLWNSNVRLLTQEEALALSYTRNMGQRNLKINTPVSHLGCWCNSSKRQGTNNGHTI